MFSRNIYLFWLTKAGYGWCICRGFDITRVNKHRNLNGGRSHVWGCLSFPLEFTMCQRCGTIFTTVEWSGRTSKQKRCGNGKNLSKRNENACYLLGEAVRHSVYVLNTLPIWVIAGKSRNTWWSLERQKAPPATYQGVWLHCSSQGANGPNKEIGPA